MKQSSKNFTNPIGLLSITLLVLCICVYKIDFAIRNFALKKTHLQITYNQFKTRKKLNSLSNSHFGCSFFAFTTISYKVHPKIYSSSSSSSSSASASQVSHWLTWNRALPLPGYMSVTSSL